MMGDDRSGGGRSAVTGGISVRGSKPVGDEALMREERCLIDNQGKGIIY